MTRLDEIRWRLIQLEARPSEWSWTKSEIATIAADIRWLIEQAERPRTIHFTGSIKGGDGGADRVALIRLAFDTFIKMTENERGLVLCWFCSACHRYVGPGDACHCSNDE